MNDIFQGVPQPDVPRGYDPSRADVLTTMERYGGSFASHLARAWQHADQSNALRLHVAFGDLYAQYRKMVVDSRGDAAKKIPESHD